MKDRLARLDAHVHPNVEPAHLVVEIEDGSALLFEKSLDRIPLWLIKSEEVRYVTFGDDQRMMLGDRKPISKR